MPQPRGTGRIAALDAIRGIAILLVVFGHYGVNIVPAGRWSFPLGSLSASGVDLFFVLSGFLIGGIILENRAATNLFRVFYLRRALRIAPLYAALLAATMLSSLVLPRLAPAAAAWLHTGQLPWWSYLTFTQNWAMAQVGDYGPRWLGVTWSLAIEEQFYLTLPLLIRVLPGRAIPFALAAIGGSAPVWRRLALVGSEGGFAAYVLTPCRADGLMLGVFIAWAVRSPTARRLLLERRRSVYACAAVALVALLDFHFGPQSYGAGYFLSLYGYSAYAVLYGCVVALAAVEVSGPLAWVLRSRMLQRAGLLAYGLYLLHLPVLGIVHGALLRAAPRLTSAGELAATIVALAATFAMAELSWRLFEKPLVTLGHRVRYTAAITAPAEIGVTPAGST